MSKILIDSEELENLLQDVQIITYTDVMQKRQNEIFETLDKAFNLIDFAKKTTNFSILEWHPSTEKPETGRTILVRHLDKNYPYDVYKVGAFILDGFGDHHYRNVREWAYLSEGN